MKNENVVTTQFELLILIEDTTLFQVFTMVGFFRHIRASTVQFALNPLQKVGHTSVNRHRSRDQTTSVTTKVDKQKLLVIP